MNRAFAEGPTALRQIRPMRDLDDAPGCAIANLEAALPPFSAGITEAHRVGHECDHLPIIAHRDRDSIDAAQRELRRNFRTAPRLARIFFDFDDLIFDAARMIEAQPPR